VVLKPLLPLTPTLLLLAFPALPLAAQPRPADGAGVVRLSRSEYDKLKDAAEAAALAPARRRTPEAPPALETATYELRIDGERTVLDVTADVSVKPPANDARLTLTGPGLLDALSDRGPGTVAAFTDPSAKKTTLLFRKEGRYRVTARYLPFERREGDRRVVDFTALPAASARLVVASLAPGLELSASAGGAPDEPLAGGATRPVPASAFVRLTVKNPARVPTAAERPVLLAEVVDVVRPERERVTVRTVVKAAVSRAELVDLVLAVPAGSELVSVTGPEEPQSTTDLARGLVTLRLARPLLGEATFSALFVRPAPAEGEPIELVPTRLPDATSVKGFLLVAPTPLRDQSPLRLDGLARTDVADLPPVARPFAEAGGTRAYRVTNGASARLVLKAPLRQVVAPPDTLLHEARLLTVFGDGTSRVDRRRFVLETKRPYFSVPLESDEEVLSVSVDQAPVKPQTDAGALVVLLPPSRAPRRLVDVTTKRKGAAPPKSGEVTIGHGPLPGTASLATWTIVVPEDRRYRVVSTSGIRKAGWSQDAPAETKTYQVSSSSWMGSGSLAFRVADTNGQPLPGVSVRLRGPGGASISGVTDAQGNVRFQNLGAGSYQAESQLAGFNTVRKKVSAVAGNEQTIAMPMSLSAKEEVVVTGESPVIDTSRSSIGYVQPGRPPGPASGRQLLSKDKERDERAKREPVAQAVEVPASTPEPAAEAVGGDAGVEGGVEGGVAGGIAGGVLAATSMDNSFVVDGVNVVQNQAGVRSLPMDVTGHGKRLVLSGPLVGGSPLSVTLKVKGK